MNKSVISLIVASGLFCSGQAIAAGDGCLAEQRTSLSHAIGVLVYDSIVSDYASFVDVEDIAAGILHASNRDKYSLSTNMKLVEGSEPGDVSGVSGKLSLTGARNVVKNWRSQSDQLGERFLSEYSHYGQQHKSGLMTYKHTLDVNKQAPFKSCADKNFNSNTDAKNRQVCYVQLNIDEAAVCDPGARVEDTFSKLSGTSRLLNYGMFNEDELIEGWVQAFDIFEDDVATTETTEKTDTSTMSVYEVVVPAELGYGGKGMPGRVAPNETLWFLMAVL